MLIYRLLWQDFALLVMAVREDHAKQGATGGSHDFLHALMVAQYAQRIAETPRLETLSWIAGICHNTDRLFPESEVENRIRKYIVYADFVSLEEREMIVEAVMNHHKLNSPKDNPVTITLKDADRLANIGPNHVIRAGQHYSKLPAYDPRYLAKPDPEATYRDPKTVYHDVCCALEWQPWLRLPKAKELARPWFDELREFLRGFKRQLEEVDLLPYPFPQDLEFSHKKK